eukprot:4717733-Amphidinium_carterae.1
MKRTNKQKLLHGSFFPIGFRKSLVLGFLESSDPYLVAGTLTTSFPALSPVGSMSAYDEMSYSHCCSLR